MLHNQLTVSIYDTSKKQLLGIFKSLEIASKYLYNIPTEAGSRRIKNALQSQARITLDTGFDFPVCVRIASQTQKEMLSDRECLILNEYEVRLNAKGQKVKY